jgi:polyketide cyclase/dehydrase/lipid transport protein
VSTVDGKPVRIAYGAVVPLPPDAAFAFVCDPLHWPSFFSSLHDSSRNEDWGSVGSQGQMSNVVLGRTINSEIEVTVWNPPHEFRYLSRQPGTPPLDNRRLFEPAPGGTRLSGTTEVPQRLGLPGLIDRARMLALRRIFAAAMARLPEAAEASHSPSPD